MKLPKTSVPIFALLSALLIGLYSYLIMAKTFPRTNTILQTCGDVLKNFHSHFHITSQGVVSVFIVVPALISVLFITLQLVGYVRTQKKLKSYKKEKMIPDKLKQILSTNKLLSQSVKLIKSDQLTAFTVGIGRPYIFVSSALCKKLSKKELEAVLLHELYHLQKRHPLWSFILSLISRIFFFIPLVDYFVRQIKTEFELLADAFAIESQGSSNYLQTALIANIQTVDGVSNFAAYGLEQRVETLTSKHLSREQITTKQIMMSALSIGLMMTLSISTPQQLQAQSDLSQNISCQQDTECVEIDCSHFSDTNSHTNFSPLIPASFSF